MFRCTRLSAFLLLAGLTQAAAAAATDRASVIDRVVAHLHASYIDAGQAARLGALLRRADFSAMADDAAFARAVSARMQEVTQDQHLRLLHEAQPSPAPQSGAPTSAEIAQRQASLRADNFGIDRVERLPENIGYLKTSYFAPASEAGPSVAAAMTLLAHTRALIIDLRDNGGGAPDGVPLLASYLFDRRTRLGDFYTREGDLTDQQWTYPAVAGSHFGATKDVYILTSKDTFSAAEGLTYALKNLKRATIIGETTRGGAHPARIKRIDGHFTLMVPVSIVRDAVTGTDWEGVGVAPDLAVPAADALRRAQQVILEKLLAHEQDAKRRTDIRQRLDTLSGRD